MKQEATKKSKLWLWLVLAAAALLVVAGSVLGIVLLVVNGGSGSGDGRPALYWNLDRAAYVDAETGMSTRTAAEDGNFYIRFAYGGEAVELQIIDKQLVNYIDSMDVMGLTFDSSKCVVDAVPFKEIATEIDSASFIQRIDGDTLYTNSSITMNGMKREITVTDNIKIYDVVPGSATVGQELTLDQLQTMDKLAIYADLEGQLTHIYVRSHVRESKIYWRANQFTSGGKTTRVPDENGVYTIPFFCEGERVEFKCKNVVEVNYIDKQSRYSAHFGLVFDEEGYIEEAIHTYEAIRGTVRSERFDITAIDGNTITTTKVIGSNTGVTDTFTIDENVIIYDVSPAAAAEGRQGKPIDSLTVTDRIVCFCDADGNPTVIYVTEHVVEDAVWCYLKERKYDSTLQQTKRVPDGNGWYIFEVFTGGQVRRVKTQDKEVATKIDSIGARVFGLTLDGDVIKHVYGDTAVFGYSHAGQGRYITGVTGAIYTCFKTSAPATAITGIMAGDCKVYNLSEVGTYGAETKLQVGDFIYAYQNPYMEIKQIFVMRRMVNLPIYYNVERKYNSTEKVTTREPDADGWYVYQVAKDSKIYTVKTQSKAMATKIDAISPGAIALSLGSDGVVYDVYAANLATGGYRRAHGYTVTKVDGKTVTTQYKNADGTIATRVLTLSGNCKTINVTPFYKTVFGEPTTVRVGDIITAFTDIYDETVLLAVRTRKSDYLYWNQQKHYDDEKTVTLRVPDADGWYVYTLLRSDGKVVTLKTQDKAIADKVDYYGGAFTLNVSEEGIIKGVGSPSNAKNTSGASLLNYDVVKIDGNKITLQYHAEGSSSDGKTEVITLNSKAKIFEVGPDAKKFGAQVKLKVGDRVRAYKSDKDDTYTYVFIRFHDSRKGGVDAYCDVCDKQVYWVPWVGGSFTTAGGHFYLPADITTDYLPCSTGRSTYPVCPAVCLDLNGHTYYRTTGRAMYVYPNATLNIQDCAGGGMVTSGGIEKGTSGGVLGNAGGVVNMYGGTLKLADEHVDMLRGGVVYIGTTSKANAAGVFNLYGGTITGGEVLGRGGNISISGGTLNIYGGVIENGTVIGGYSGEHGGGGNIVTMSKGVINMYGGTITGGTSYGSGGNVFAGTGEFNIYGGTISDGTAKTAGGGNIYALEKLHLYGGTITGGTSLAKSGGNIALYRSDDYAGDFYAENCEITNGTGVGYGGNIYCEVGGTMINVKLSGGTANNGGNIYGSKEWTLKNVTITDGKAVNGGGGNISAAGKWTMENVTITGGTSSERGGNIYASGVDMLFKSGVISGGTSGTGNSNGGGNIFLVSNAVVEIAGGKVENGVSKNTGGNILVGTGTLKVSGGEIVGGTAETKANGIYAYYSKSNVEITGGHMDAVTYTDAATFKISGNPVIDLLEIEGGKIVEVGELTEDAKIKVAADGVFTNVLTNPNAYIGIFESANESTLYVEDSALAMGAGVKEAECAICSQTVLWKKWTGVGVSGHYYLEDAVALDAEVNVPAGSKLTLDLCGKTVTSSARAFLVNGDMVVFDSVGGGEIVGAEAGTKAATNGGVIRVKAGSFDLHSGTLRYAGTGVYQGGVLYLESGATANLIGGTVTGGITNERGGNISVAGASTLNISGTTVEKGTANSSNSNGGGNIFIVGSSIVNISGGKVIRGKTTKTGGNILVGTGTLNISGGEITGGEADGVGQNVYVYYTGSNCNITGGNIESLTYTDAASFSLSGNPVIGQLQIASGKVVTLGDLVSGADISVEATGTFTTANENAQTFVDNGYVKLVDTSKVLAVEENKLVVSELPEGAISAPCAHCDGATVTWYKFSGDAGENHYYLEENFDLTETYGIAVAEGTTAVINLNGKKMVGGKIRAFDNSGDLFIMDTVGGGEIVTGGPTDADSLGGVIRVRKGNFTLYSGTVRLADDHSTTIKRGGVLYLDGTANVRILGGAVMNGVTTERGGNIFVAGGSAKLTVEGGKIECGTCGTGNANGGGNIAVLTGSTVEIKGGLVTMGTSPKTAGNILATGNLIISGGTVEKGVADGIAQDIYVMNNSGDVTISGGHMDSLTANKPKSLTVSGKPEIGCLELVDGQKMTLGTLEEGANMVVSATGIFTEANENAESYVTANYIRAFDKHEITVESNQLSMNYKTNSYCAHCDQNVTWTAWDGVANEGHVYMPSNLTVTARVDPSAGKTLVIDLNGCTYTNSATKAFSVKGTLAIMDSLGTGAVVGSGVTGGSNMNGGVIYVEKGTFELYSGTVKHAPGSGSAYRGGVLYASGAVINLKGGVITGGKTSERGGNIYATGATTLITLSGTKILNGNSGDGNNSVSGGNVFITSSAAMTMNGGAIKHGTSARAGGNVAVGTGTFTMTGGTISGGTAPSAADLYIYYSGSNADISGGKIGVLTYTDAASFKLSGNPVIDTFEIAEGKTVTLGEMTEGASVSIAAAATGKVAEANANAQAYLTAGYFKPASANITLTVESDELIATVS